jgi:23S rRNA (pseudouridine1915-N3)-methyltransferase
MNQIRIIAVGKLKEPYYAMAQAEYLKRLKIYLKLELIEVDDLPSPEKASLAQEEAVLKQEAASIQSLISPRDFLVTLDRQGKEMTSLELAEFINQRTFYSEPLVFIIGGSLGLDDELIKTTKLNLSFSKLTFPHQLFRIMLLEQIYRAVKINRGEPYHK